MYVGQLYLISQFCVFISGDGMWYVIVNNGMLQEYVCE